MIPTNPAGSFGGYLTYHPRFKIEPDTDLYETLRDILLEQTHVEEPENWSTPVDWFCNNIDGPPYTLRESIVLCRDGGDSEQPAVLFYRTQDGGLVHVPPPDAQATLGVASDRLWQFDIESKLAEITAYLTSIIADPTAWQPIAIKEPS